MKYLYSVCSLVEPGNRFNSTCLMWTIIAFGKFVLVRTFQIKKQNKTKLYCHHILLSNWKIKMGIGKIRNDLNFDDFSLKPVGLYLAINIPHRWVYCTRAFPNFVSLLQKIVSIYSSLSNFQNININKASFNLQWKNHIIF